jgi:tetratricopeptide (TPR) repeat protein
MKPFRSPTAVFAAVLAAATVARAQDAVDALWRDPEFHRQFVAGYGTAPDVEPKIGKAEAAVLERLWPLMSAHDDEKKRAEAIAELQGRIKPDSNAMYDFLLGSIYFEQDKLPEALASLTAATQKYPNFRRAWRSLAFVQCRRADHDGAIAAFTRWLALGGADAYAYGLLGHCYTQKQDYQPAEAAFRNALMLQPNDLQWRLGLTQCVLRQEKFEDARALLDTLIARTPDKAEFWLLQAQALLGLKQPLRAAEDLEVVDRLGKATVDSTFTLGDIYLTEHLPDLALRAYERAVDRDEKQPVARALRAAESLAGRGDLAQARQLAAHVRTKLGPGLAEADRRKLLKLEARFTIAEGNGTADAVKLLDEIVQLDPLDGEALMLLGKHFGKINEPDRAILYFERAAGIEAYEAEAKVRQAQALVGLARYSEALPLLRRAQQVKPREEVARYLEQVERVARSQR